MNRQLLFLVLLLSTVFPSAAQHPPANTYRITGVVVDAATGTPLPRAQVSVTIKSDEARTVTDDNGAFRMEGLEPGKYPLYGEAQGYLHEGYNQHGAFLTAVAVGDGLDSEHLVLRLHRQAVIHGRVTDERADPSRHAQVLLFSAENTGGKRPIVSHGQTQTDDLGEFRFAHLSPGKYYVAIQAQPWYAQSGFRYLVDKEQANFSFGLPHMNPTDALDVVYPVTFYPGVVDEHKASEINLLAGVDEEVNVQLLPVPAVHLRLTNISSNDREPVNVRAIQNLFGTFPLMLQAPSAPISHGEYEIAGLPPGDVALNIDEIRNREQRSRMIKTNANQDDTLDSTQGGIVANVSGRVIFPAGNEHPERAHIDLAGDDNQNSGTHLQKDGTFSLPSVQAGTYRIFVYAPGLQQQFVGRISGSGAQIVDRQVTVSGSGDVQLTITMGEGVAHVDGVAQLDGKPAAGVMILMIPESGQDLEQDSRRDQSDSDGTFALANILPGKYVFMAIENGWDLEWMNLSVLKPYRERGFTLQLAPNETRKITVEVQRASDDNSKESDHR